MSTDPRSPDAKERAIQEGLTLLFPVGLADRVQVKAATRRGKLDKIHVRLYSDRDGQPDRGGSS